MKNTRPKRRRLLFILTALLLLGAGFFLLLPQLVKLPLVHEKTTAFIARQIPGEITYRNETLSLFPMPCIHFYDVRLKIDRQFSATIGQVSATPHFFSLLRGRFNISKLTFAGIDAEAQLPEQARTQPSEMTLGAVRQRLETWVDMLDPVKQKKFVLDIRGAALSLLRGEESVSAIQDIDGRLTWRLPVLSLDMTSRTDLWKQGRLTIETDIATGKISGRLSAEDLVPGAICDSVFPDAPLRLKDASLDADISWEIENPGTWRLSMEATDPDITFDNGDTRLNLRGKRAAAELRRNKTGLRASISELDLDAPDLRLTGEFELNTETPYAGWKVNVNAADIASTRTAAMFFAGRFKTTQHITQALREGGATRLVMGQDADSLDGLRKVATFHLRGRLHDATISVPKTDLLLTESSGNVSVSWGILTASNIETRLGNSTGNSGSFTLALTGEKPWPWSVACDVQADAAQLPPLLERLTGGTALAREMSGIESAEGSVTGSLALDRDTDGLRVTVDASKFDLSARYHRIPFPVTLSGDRFYYQGREVRVQGLRGDIGGSHLSDLDAGIDWEAAPRLSISSARGEVAVNELTSWIGGKLTACRAPEDEQADSGQLRVDHLEFDGPLQAPSSWRLKTDGAVEKPFTVCMPLFPEALTIYEGTFAATQDRIDVDDADLLVQGSRFTATGSLEGWLAEEFPLVLNAELEGSLGLKASDWVYSRAGIPDILRWRAPISLAPLSLQWQETDGLNVSGEAAVESGPRLSFSISKAGDVFAVKNLDIQDAESRATLSMTRDRDAITARFSGNLHRNTVSAILADNRMLSGSLQGDAEARFDASPPFFRSMTGGLQASGLDLAPIGLPLQISQASVTGNGASVDVDDTRLTWKENDFSTSGRLDRAGESIVLDLNLATGQLDWPAVKSLISGDRAGTPLLLGDIRFTSTRLSLTPTLTFEPFGALLKLDGSQTEIEFQKADACGISFPGTLTIMPDRMLFAFKPTAAQQDLATTTACLKEGTAFMDGSFDLSGDIAFEWEPGSSLMEAIEGSASLTAMDGRIYKGGFLGKLFSMLNVSEVMSGQLPDFEKEGFPYKNSIFEGKFKSGKFELETGVIDGPAMKIFFEGAEDLINKEHALTIVVAPLKTLDAMVDKIPVLNDVLEKGLVVYPVKVTGGWEDPQLAILSPTAVGGEVLGLMLRTLKAPVKVFEKILSGSKTDPEKTTP